MPDEPSRAERVAAFVAQDREINESRLKEFRMTLEESLATWEHDAAIVRRAAWISLVVLLLDYAAVIPISAVDKSLQGFLFPLWSLVGILALVLTIVLSGLYQWKYARRVKQGRFDLQMAMLRELQEQVAELRQQSGLPPRSPQA